MPFSLAQFEKHLGGAQLKPAYLLAGEEHLLVLEAADALRRRARALGYAEREVYDVEAKFDWDELTHAASSMSLFAARKVIDLRLPTGKPGTDGAAALQQYCERPPPDTILLVTATQWSKAHQTAWVTALERIGVFVPCWPLKPSEFSAWIAQRMAAQGLSATSDATAVLIERSEGNLLAAAQEIDKLVLLHGAGKVDAEEMQALVTDNARFDVFRLTDAALSGDSNRALRVLEGLRGEGEAVPALLGWLLMQLQSLARLGAVAASGGSLSQAFNSERVWDARQSMFKRALARGRVEFWERCVADCARIDRISKGREGGDAWRELERLLLRVADPRNAMALSA